MPKVSVITTVFNGQEYIDRSIQSILGQDYSDFEWVIVDDGSTDNTLRTLRSRLGDNPRVRIFGCERLGRASALNFAVRKSEGRYIANHDIDDVSYEQRLSTQAQLLEENPNVGVVGGNHIALDKTRGEKYVRKQPTNHEDIVWAMTHYIPISHNIATFRRNVWVEVGGYPDAENAIDMRMWLRVLDTKWEIHNPPVILGKHVIHSGSFWKDNFSYIDRQIDLLHLNIQVIERQNFSYFAYAYPLLRVAYSVSPKLMKRLARKIVHRING